MKNKLLIFIFITISLSLKLFSNEATTDIVTTINDIVDVKSTLTFGIEAEIVNFVKSLNEPLSDEYMDLILVRYKKSTLSVTKIGLINYFVRCDKLKENILQALFDDVISDDIDRQIKVNIFYALAKHGNETHFAYLFEQLDSDDKVIVSSASTAINRIKDKSVSPLVLKKLTDALDNPEINMSTDVRNNLILSLGELEYKESAEYLRKLLNDNPDDNFLVMYSMYSLAKISDLESIDLIKSRLGSDEKRVKDYAAYSLSTFKAPEMLAIYEDMLLHNDSDVRIYACRGAVNNKFESLIEILLYRFNNDPEMKVRNEALKSLVLLGNNGIAKIKESLKNKKYNYTHYYVISESLVDNPYKEAVDFTIELYDVADKKGKEIIAKNAIKVKSNQIDPLIDKLLSSTDYLIRLGAINSILSIPDTSLKERLKSISDSDSVPAVKKSAAKVLSVLGSGN